MTTINDFKLITQVVSPSAEDEFFAELEAVEPISQPNWRNAGYCTVTTNWFFQNGACVTQVRRVFSSRGHDHTHNILILNNKKGN